jgi:7,8-dihydroneopterin aldolase/epimerase/oxygenase
MQTSDLKVNLKVNGLRLKINLGHFAEERKNPQEVDISFKLIYSQPPKCCGTDNLEDGICYAELSDVVKKVSAAKEFKLIEQLTFEVYKALREKVRCNVKLWVKVAKLTPPIQELEGSVDFVISDIEDDEL